MPVSSPVKGTSCTGASAQEKQTYHPSASLEIVTVLGVPSSGRDQRTVGQYGDAAVIAQIIQAGVFLVTRGRGYQLLEHPQIQRVLAHPPTTTRDQHEHGEVVELFEGGWLPLDEGLPRVRVIVARHLAPAPDKPVTVGKRIDGWVYELFMTTLDAERFLVEDVLDLYHGRGAFEGVLADEVRRRRPGSVVFSQRSVGKNSGKLFATGCGTCGWLWDTRCRPGERREIEWAPPKEATLVFVVLRSST